MYKILKHFEKGQVIPCNYHTQQTARIDPAICWCISFLHQHQIYVTSINKKFVTLSRIWLLRMWQGRENLLKRVIKGIC